MDVTDLASEDGPAFGHIPQGAQNLVHPLVQANDHPVDPLQPLLYTHVPPPRRIQPPATPKTTPDATLNSGMVCETGLGPDKTQSWMRLVLLMSHSRTGAAAKSPEKWEQS